jgi:hypothetical protein
MVDLLQTGAAWLGDVLNSHVARSVRYCRGSIVKTVTATPADADFSSAGDVAIEWEGRDWLIDKSALSDDFETPQRGDQILDGDDVHEVQAPAGMAVAADWDRYGEKWRIHTVLTESG